MSSKPEKPEHRSSEHQSLRRRLADLVADAHRNERSLRRFQSLELRLLDCETLPALLKLLVQDARESCDWDRVSLFLQDPEYEIRRLLERAGVDPLVQPDLVFFDEPNRLQALYGRVRSPRLGPFLPGRHGDLFGAMDGPIASVALLPLERYGRLFGSLNLGSHRQDRFPRDAGSDFLHHLAAIIAVCLEMVIIRERLQHLGLTDALTAVNNRRFFDQRLPEEIARAQRSGTAVSCLFMDVDYFKRFNDAYGHQAGDQVLRSVAAIARGSLRKTDVLARYGGEEFAAILAQAQRDEALEIANRIRERVAAARFAVAGAEEASVSISIGVATLDPGCGAQDPTRLGQRLVEAADRGLYRAKAGGRNRVVVAGLG